MIEAPQDELENKKFRIVVLDKCEKDLEFRALILKKCETDILFWIRTFAFTYNPRLDNSVIPFITYKFQDNYITGVLECIETGIDNFTEKSRDMGFSWMMVAIAMWYFLFKKSSILYGSYKEDYVDSMGNMDSFFERLRFMKRYLPKWMIPTDLIEKFMNFSSQKLGSEIAGDTGAYFGRGGRRKFVILDEFSYWQYDMSAFRGTRDVTNCRIFGGTPNGAYNVYGKVMTGSKDYEHLAIKKFRLYWKDHPMKTQEWYDKEKTKRTREDVARELDISYDDSVQGAVYKTFTQDCMFKKNIEYDPSLPLFTAWDFGRDSTAIIWWQKDLRTGNVYIFDTYQNMDKEIDFYMAFISGKPTQGYQYTDKELDIIADHAKFKSRYQAHYGDPYNGNSKSVVTNTTIADIFRHYGYYLDTKPNTTVEERIRKATLAFRRTFIKEDLYEFVQSIIQSRYPQQKENSQNVREQTLPIHDINSHFRTAMEYLFDNEEDIMPIRVSRDEDYYEEDEDGIRLFAKV